MADVRMRDVPEQLAVTEQRSVDQAALEAWLPGAMARVAAAAGGHGGPLGTADWPYLERPAEPNAQVFVVIYDGNPNEGPVPVECCATVPAATDDVATRRIPAHREAYARVTKAMVEGGELGAVYPAIEKWITSNGLDIAGPPRETYWTDFFGAGPGDEVFDVSFPVT